ncbi:hypothetical protein Tco_1053913 [Tanacetum coccineum]|uniref:Uncharacterized protein n=1 Tax=Tanacetum coccineum TaxID=301880 RepID=A0ABQ5GWI1_9ASTR
MVEKSMLNNKGKITGPMEIRLVWDNTARVNHQSKLTHPHPTRNFIPAAVLTKSGQVPVNAAKQSSHRAAISISAAKHVNTVAPRPNVNDALPTTYVYFKAYSPNVILNPSNFWNNNLHHLRANWLHNWGGDASTYFDTSLLEKESSSVEVESTFRIRESSDDLFEMSRCGEFVRKSTSHTLWNHLWTALGIRTKDFTTILYEFV